MLILSAALTVELMTTVPLIIGATILLNCARNSAELLMTVTYPEVSVMTMPAMTQSVVMTVTVHQRSVLMASARVPLLLPQLQLQL